MTVRKVISETMRLVGRVVEADGVDSMTITDTTARLKRAMLTYLNAVFDELARGYFPLDTQESLTSENGVYPFADFLKTPIKINRVESDNHPVEYRVYPDYLQTDAKEITVFYEYAPPELTETDEFFYPVYAVSKRLVQYGMAAEYYLVSGDGTAYALWENRYRSEIDALMSRSTVKGRIPPRRWI